MKLPDGTRIEKCRSLRGDAHGDGSLGTVRSSLSTGEDTHPYFYFVEWDDFPGVHVGVSDHRIRPIAKGTTDAELPTLQQPD